MSGSNSSELTRLITGLRALHVRGRGYVGAEGPRKRTDCQGLWSARYRHQQMPRDTAKSWACGSPLPRTGLLAGILPEPEFARIVGCLGGYFRCPSRPDRGDRRHLVESIMETLQDSSCGQPHIGDTQIAVGLGQSISALDL